MSNRIATAQAIARSMAHPVMRSGLLAGAEEATNSMSPARMAPLRKSSGPRVGDGKANDHPPEKAIHDVPAVQNSGASVSGEETRTGAKPMSIPSPRKSALRKRGADLATGPVQPLAKLPDPQPSGLTAGVSDAIPSMQSNRRSHPDETSGESRADEGQCRDETQSSCALIGEIVQLGRARRDWMKTRVAIELRGIAICRRYTDGDKDEAMKLWKLVKEGQAPDVLIFAAGPLLAPIESLKEHETKVDRAMTKLAAKHEMAPWAKAIRGFGHAGLAKVIAECGDLGSYRNPSCVWKRMGVAVINGGRQRRVPGAEALDHGYNAERRSVLWNVGGAVIGGMGKGPRPLVGEDIDARTDLTEYQKLFVRRLRLEAERDPENHAREPVTNKETGVTKESFSAHAANRAKRYVEKRLLRDLWIAWRRAGQDATATHNLCAGSPISSGE